jgi:MFS family permease
MTAPPIGGSATPSAPDTPANPADEAVGTFASLRLRNFRLLLLGTTLSNAAQWIQQVTVSWLVYDMTGSGAALGSVNLVRAAASLGFAPVAGVAIDRWPRQRLMLAVNGWLLVISLLLGLALTSQSGQVWWLFAFAFLGGMAQAIDMPLRQTVVFVLVPRRLAPNAVALIQTGWALMRSLGPAIGGVLIVWFGAGGNFLVQAGIYAIIAVNTLQLRFPPAAPGATARKGGLRSLAEGVRYIVHQRETRAFVMMGWVLPLLIIPNYVALPPIYAKSVFQGGPAMLGALMSAVGVGGIAGGLVAASLGRVDRRGLVQLGALFLTAASLIGFALSRDLLPALVMLALSGFFEMVFLTSNQTLLQLSIPDAMRGRVMSIVSLNMALSPLGAFLAGLMADLIGPQAVTLVLCGGAALVAIGTAIFSPTIRDYRISRALAAAPADD